MKPSTLRLRLTIWYLAILVPATLALAIGSWWLVRWSVVGAADAGLRARVDAVRAFIAASETALPHEELQDELCEYIQLTSGEALLDVESISGRVRCQPALTGWDDLDRNNSLTAAETVRIAPRTFRGQPMRVAGVTLQSRDDRYRVVVAAPMASAYDALTRFQWVLVCLVPAVLLAAGLAGYWVAGRALAPVDRMTRDVQAITVRNLERRLVVPPEDDELRRLALTFNDMVARLQTSVADMARFTAEASHELRTPVTLVRATADVALGRDRDAREYRQALREILTESERMSTLVDDLLMLARADAGVEPLDVASVDLRDIATETLRGFQSAIDVGTLRAAVDLPDTPVPVAGSAASLRRLAVILVENAIKYTPAGGNVGVRVARNGESALFEVTDSGIGVEHDDATRAFERFYRGAAARQHAASGSGLGLAIAKTIVERHHGTIAMESAGSGQGCRVSVMWSPGTSPPCDT